MIRIAIITGLFYCTAVSVSAQEKAPDLSAFSPETRKEYEATQKFIDQTQSKIGLVRSQTEARAKEIEALANRVGDIITKMSGQGEDNTALLSEISVLNELLALERKTTAELRQDNTALTDSMAALQKANADAQAKLGEKLQRQQAELTKAQEAHAAALKLKQAELKSVQQRLTEALQSAQTREKTNNVLVSNVETLTAETERLKKQVKLLKENRYRPKRRLSPPK